MASGSLIFGFPGKAIAFSRDNGDFKYDAPVIATASIGAELLPAIAMLCQNVSTADSGRITSTDVLVSRTSTQLLDAAALANQTFNFYREDCAMGGGNLQAMWFDAQGNGTFPSGSGSQTLNAATVTRLLNGQVLKDPSTGKLLAFSAYLYVHHDSVKYVIVQRQGNRTTGVTEGSLATWTQE
ncbi:hypothetical protein GJ698_30155 [Pseudoduganella sp. FT26W]|uniref:Uncharacterized protein n=1 Tax=Duganella aquatilis TaxID=2666082 RepID=A0A844DHW6_9BURK|nr:hypothetical protein [Duganella aquatilis]